jgi:hypothetical protein
VPILFVAALITLWLLGMHAVTDGIRAIEIARNPLSESLSPIDGDGLAEIWQRAFVEGVSRHADVTFPVGVAQLLLGALLAIVSIRALFGRRGSATFFLQVVAANAGVVLVAYYLHDPVRNAVVEAIIAHGIDARPPETGRAEFESLARAELNWVFRFWLVAQLLGFGFAAFVLTRRSVRELYAGARGTSNDGQ